MSLDLCNIYTVYTCSYVYVHTHTCIYSIYIYVLLQARYVDRTLISVVADGKCSCAGSPSHENRVPCLLVNVQLGKQRSKWQPAVIISPSRITFCHLFGADADPFISALAPLVGMLACPVPVGLPSLLRPVLVILLNYSIREQIKTAQGYLVSGPASYVVNLSYCVLYSREVYILFCSICQTDAGHILEELLQSMRILSFSNRLLEYSPFTLPNHVHMPFFRIFFPENKKKTATFELHAFILNPRRRGK